MFRGLQILPSHRRHFSVRRVADREGQEPPGRITAAVSNGFSPHLIYPIDLFIDQVLCTPNFFFSLTDSTERTGEGR